MIIMHYLLLCNEMDGLSNIYKFYQVLPEKSSMHLCEWNYSRKSRESYISRKGEAGNQCKSTMGRSRTI